MNYCKLQTKDKLTLCLPHYAPIGKEGAEQKQEK